MLTEMINLKIFSHFQKVFFLQVSRAVVRFVVTEHISGVKIIVVNEIGFEKNTLNDLC